MGDVIGDLNKRRGQVEGMDEARSGARVVKAKVPLSEMFGYVTALRTITSGRATSSMVYHSHIALSSNIAREALRWLRHWLPLPECGGYPDWGRGLPRDGNPNARIKVCGPGSPG